MLKWFGSKDVRKITTREFTEYMDYLTKKRPDLTASTKNTIMASFRNVLKMARDDGAIDVIPNTPRAKQRDNPRPFLRFYPLVARKDDAYKKVLDTAKQMAREGITVRGITVTDELYDLILFLVHSFVRPVVSEVYAIRHSDVTVAKDPKGLIVIVRDGKTGFRAANTMPGAVAVYERIRKRYHDSQGDDYLFLPQYKNRTTASQIFQRQFRELMARAGVGRDPITGKAHTIYSLRHTAICMRLILSQGQVNILQPRQKRRHFGGPDRTLLCSQFAAFAGDGDQSAEFWERPGVKAETQPFPFDRASYLHFNEQNQRVLHLRLC